MMAVEAKRMIYISVQRANTPAVQGMYRDTYRVQLTHLIERTLHLSAMLRSYRIVDHPLRR